MKKSVEIVGLPIVSLVDGEEIGIVKSLVIDAADAAIAAIVIEDGRSYKGAKLIHFGDVSGIGESALTIEKKSVINELSKVPELEKLLEANVNVISTKVLSKKGQIKGTIIEVYFDPESGKIVECHAKSESGNDFTITANRIYTLASNITVVAEDNEEVSDKPAAAARPAPTPASIASVAPAAPAPQPAEENVGDAAIKDDTKKFVERQMTFMIVKKANRKLVTDAGVEIINQGEEVTDEVIQKAKAAGKFVELSMSLQ
jgi:uncharacterized protein YrrD